MPGAANDTETDGQPEPLPGLARTGARRPRATKPSAGPVAPLATVDPVARVLVDVPLAHLDRPFDYGVPEPLSEGAQPGVRVKVRFAGRDVNGYVVERSAETQHVGALTPLRRVVSPEPVLSEHVADLTAAVAQRYAGTRSDVLRLAIPPRHAATEARESMPSPEAPAFDAAAAEAAWVGHEPAAAYLRHLASGEPARAVWNAAPGTDWPSLLAHAAAATRAAGGGVLICVPDGKDVERVSRALAEVLGEGQHVALTAEAGPARRYRDFLAVARGQRRVVVGTRAAAFAPVRDLGLVAIWDDGDDLHAEPRAPYPHTREVLLLRAEREGTAALVGGFARTVEADLLLRTGWAHALVPPREVLRERLTVTVAGGDDRSLARDRHAAATRLPTAAHHLIRDGLRAGPVLVQTPRSGYAAALTCGRCRTPARCAACTGPLALDAAGAPPTCRWCGTPAAGWACPECGHHGLRAPVVGEARTAEELGRSFPGTVVKVSAGSHVLTEVDEGPSIVVATPGAEPVAHGGYAAAVLLDTWLMLGLAHLRVEEEALRRWSNALGLVRPGGAAVAVGDPAEPALQALVRWDPAGFADRQLAQRQQAHLPPASRLATITGDPAAVDDALTLLEVPADAEVLGPVAVGGRSDPESRVVIRVPRARGSALSQALGHLQRLRSSRKLDAVRVQVDPLTL